MNGDETLNLQRIAYLESECSKRDAQIERLRKEYKQRGERMIRMKFYIGAQGFVDPFAKWFDPETGEPL